MEIGGDYEAFYLAEYLNLLKPELGTSFMIDYWNSRGVLAPLNAFMKGRPLEVPFESLHYMVSCNVALEDIRADLFKFLRGPCCRSDYETPEQSISNLSRELVGLLTDLRDVPRNENWKNIYEKLEKIEVRLRTVIDQLESRSSVPMGFRTNVRDADLFLAGSVCFSYETDSYLVLK